MAFRRSSNSSGRSYSFRSRFRRPLAKKQFIWCNQIATVANSVTTTRVVLLNTALWIANASAGNMAKAKLEKLIVLPSDTGNQNQVAQQTMFALYIDDADASDPGDPSTVSFYDAAQPFYVGLRTHSATTGGVIDGNTNLNLFPDFCRRVFTPKRQLRTDKVLWMSWQPQAVTSGTAALSVFVRALISLD